MSEKKDKLPESARKMLSCMILAEKWLACKILINEKQFVAVELIFNWLICSNYVHRKVFLVQLSGRADKRVQQILKKSK